MTVSIDKIFPQIRVDGAELPLTRREYDMFVFLWENRGKICTRDNLQAYLVGINRFANDRLIDILVMRLRKKLINTPLKLETKRGYGYRFPYISI